MFKENFRKGFTLGEVLVALAVIVVLALLATPAVISIRREMEEMRLENTARSIYISAQNRLSGLKSSGKVGFLPRGDKNVTLTQRPSDFPTDEASWEDGDYHYIELNSEEMGTFFPPGTIDASFNDGHFIIEYNIRTGMVYGVFFADEKFKYSERSVFLPDQSSPCLQSISILSFHLCIGLLSDVFTSCFPPKPCMHFYSPPHALYLSSSLI